MKKSKRPCNAFSTARTARWKGAVRHCLHRRNRQTESHENRGKGDFRRECSACPAENHGGFAGQAQGRSSQDSRCARITAKRIALSSAPNWAMVVCSLGRLVSKTNLERRFQRLTAANHLVELIATGSRRESLTVKLGVFLAHSFRDSISFTSLASLVEERLLGLCVERVPAGFEAQVSLIISLSEKP